MFRRFSLNFAIFSMFMDAAVILLMLYVATLVRPALSAFPFIAQLGGSAVTPSSLYVVFPLCWVAIFASFDLYVGKKHIRAVDEFTVLSLASVVAGVSLAGILYLSFRDVSRAQYLLFLLL